MILYTPLSHESSHESLLGKEYDKIPDAFDEEMDNFPAESEYPLEEE